ncbi:MAG: hypothetical protein KDK70_34585, partial [Myxococcales bacterium]|nr:hypothetical protein [Myxococcales bacterium]
LALAMLLGPWGCPSSPTGGAARHHAQEPSRTDLEGIELRSLSVRTDAPAVKEYGAAVDHALSEAERSVVAALADLPLTHLPALSRMVRALARDMPDKTTPPSLVDGLMMWSGLPDPHPTLITVEIPQDDRQCHLRIGPGCQAAVTALVQEVSDSLAQAQSQLTGVGIVGLPDGSTRMMVALLERAVELRPIPLAVGRRGSFRVAGQLLGARSKPRVEVVGPSGQWSSLPVTVAADGFSTRVSCVDGPGAYQVEVLADGTHGPEVAANFPVYCGVDPPDSISMDVEVLDPSVTALQIARANFLYLNEERERRGLPSLQWDADAAAIAAGHSEDMRDHDYVGHRSPSSGEVTDRFEAAGVRSTVVRENVALGYGPKGIHESLMSSPGHRVNILATDVSHVGIGVVMGDPRSPSLPRPVYATQNFFQKPGAGVPAGDLGPVLRERVDEQRRAQGLPALRWDDALSVIAQRNADAVGRGKPPPKGYDQEVFALGYVGVSSHQLASIDFGALVGAQMWSELHGHVGLGVARTKERGGDEGFVAVVLEAKRE